MHLFSMSSSGAATSPLFPHNFKGKFLKFIGLKIIRTFYLFAHVFKGELLSSKIRLFLHFGNSLFLIILGGSIIYRLFIFIFLAISIFSGRFWVPIKVVMRGSFLPGIGSIPLLDLKPLYSRTLLELSGEEGLFLAGTGLIPLLDLSSIRA